MRKVVGFKKIKFYTSENVGYGDVNLPDQDLHTTSYWFTVPQDELRSLGYNRSDLIDGLLGIAYALHHLSAVALMCDPRDLDRCVGDKSAEWFVRHDLSGRGIYSSTEAGTRLDPERIDAFDPTIFIYDAYPGGIGLAPQIFTIHQTLLRRARDLIGACPCESGCPSCVGPVNEVGVKSKEVALKILDLLHFG